MALPSNFNFGSWEGTPLTAADFSPQMLAEIERLQADYPRAKEFWAARTNEETGLPSTPPMSQDPEAYAQYIGSIVRRDRAMGYDIDSSGFATTRPASKPKWHEKVAKAGAMALAAYVGGQALTGAGAAGGGATAGTTTGAGASANATGLAQMGSAAGLSGAELEAFVASGGTLGSTAAGGGGIGLGAANAGAAAANQQGLYQMAFDAGLEGEAADAFVASGGTMGSTAFGGGGIAGMATGAPIGTTPVGLQSTGPGVTQAGFDWMQAPAGPGGSRITSSALSDPRNIIGIGSALANIYGGNQSQNAADRYRAQLEEAFARSDPFAQSRGLAGAEYNQMLLDPESYMSSPLARMQIDELNRATRTKQAQLGQTWNVDETGNIRGSGTGAVDFARQLQFNLAKQYETALGNRAQQAGMSLFPSAEMMRSMGQVPGLEQAARQQKQTGFEVLGGTAMELFPSLNPSNWGSTFGA